MMFKKIAGAVLTAAALSTCAFTAAPAAHAATARPHIIDGTPAPQTDWAVQLKFNDVTNPGAVYGCTGEHISAQWILTAQHCIQNVSWMNVYFSNDSSNPGEPVAADNVMGSPNGDVALVHLSTPVNYGPLAPLADSYVANPGDQGVIMGFGLGAYKQPTGGLFQANVQVLGESTDAFGGQAVHIQGIDGASNHGDSGGPLLINGAIVAVCSTGDSVDPGGNTNATSNYANLTNSRQWIYDNAGV